MLSNHSRKGSKSKDIFNSSRLFERMAIYKIILFIKLFTIKKSKQKH